LIWVTGGEVTCCERFSGARSGSACIRAVVCRVVPLLFTSAEQKRHEPKNSPSTITHPPAIAHPKVELLFCAIVS